MSSLNQAEYASGDVKPENCLIYTDDSGNRSLKVSDFGQTRKVGDGTKTYMGNLRFSPPEGVLSVKGDSWGAALVLIRSFEELITDNNGDPLIEIEPANKEDRPATQGRRGVEKFIVEHKVFLGIDTPSLSDKLFRRLPRQVKLNSRP